MCGHAKFGKKVYEPGMVLPIRTQYGETEALWGLSGGRIYNARAETVYETWARLSNPAHRCILQVSQFQEGNAIFRMPHSTLLLGGIYDDENKAFAVLTVPSTKQIAPFHHRMPVIVNGHEQDFLLRNFIHFNCSEFKPEQLSLLRD